MNERPLINGREMIKITLSLAVTCLVAAAILGAVYAWTEPTTRTLGAAREATLVRRLLALDAQATVSEYRRYLWDNTTPLIGYLTPTELRRYDPEGKIHETIPRPATLHAAAGVELDQWVAQQFPTARFVGRFFVAANPQGVPTGYVTEEEQYGFKSRIRFFVACAADLQIRGVEVVAHEEDPGLGAEITKPFFKDQFRGRHIDALPNLHVVQGPQPHSGVEGEAPPALPAEGATRAPEIDPIYAVTGATISSRALTEGVKRAVLHLQHRLQVLGLTKGAGR